MERKAMSFKKKMLVFPILMLAIMISMAVLNEFMNQRTLTKIVYPKVGESVLKGSQDTLKTATDIESTLIGEAIKGVSDKQEQVAIITSMTDSVRFFDDNSGYFFVFEMDGTNVNHPANKSVVGTDMSENQDKKGNYFIKDFIKVAKEGSGFVEYYYDKPGKGIQPKLSYITMIPGTELFIGTGVYIDNVQEYQAIVKNEIKQAEIKSMYIKGFMLFMATALSLVIAVVITRSIIKPLSSSTSVMRRVAEQVRNASSQVSAASQSLAEGATEQAAGLEETSSSLEEMSSMTKQNADNAQQANTLANDANVASQTGTKAMCEMSSAISDIQKSSEETSKIIKVIDEIAFQTNLLALNAAVEAARAGEAGKGFAVVAEEVRNLAMRSAEAAKNTSAMIEGAVSKANNGVEIVDRVSKNFEEINNSVSKVNALIAEIAAASNEQAQGIDQINSAVTEMDKATQANAASAEESASASGELTAQADKMQSVVISLANIVGGSTSVAEKFSKRTAYSQGNDIYHSIAGSGSRVDSMKLAEVSDGKAAKAIPFDDDFGGFNI